MDEHITQEKSGVTQAGRMKAVAAVLATAAVAASAAAAFPIAAYAGTKAKAVATTADAAAADKADKMDKAAGGKAAPRQAATPVCTGELPATVTMNIPEGKSELLDLPRMQLPAPAWLRSVGDPEVVQVEPLTSQTPRNMFFLFGKKVGATNLMFQNKEGRCAMVEVSVGIDTAAVQASLTRLLPNEKGIKVSAAANSLVISGTASDAGAVDRIMTIAGAFVRGSGAGGAGGNPADRIVNMMSVGAPQQVMLEVKVAEVSKSLMETLGVNLTAAAGIGGMTFSMLSNFSAGSDGTMRLDRNKGNATLTLDAARKNGLVKILAEPTVMAISGQDGSFLAGGRIFIPVSQDANGRISLEEKEFGVGLRFTPTVLDGGRINLKVAPEVSELSREGVGISSSGTGGNSVLPLITTRRAATTVQLFDGQSFVIGGLIKNNVTESVNALPVLGELPVLGPLFRSSDFQTDKTELVFIVTPRLVKPLPAGYGLPTDRFVEPTRKEFFIDGKMESAPQMTPAARNAAPATGFQFK